MARTTSLTVTPSAFFSSLTSSSEMVAKATLRCARDGRIQRGARRGERQSPLGLVRRSADPPDAEHRAAGAPGQAGDVDGRGEAGGERLADQVEVRRHLVGAGSRARAPPGVEGRARGRTAGSAAPHPTPRRWSSGGSSRPWPRCRARDPRRCTSPTGAWSGRAGGRTRRPRIRPAPRYRPARGARRGACGSRGRSPGRRSSRDGRVETGPPPAGGGTRGPGRARDPTSWRSLSKE